MQRFTTILKIFSLYFLIFYGCSNNTCEPAPTIERVIICNNGVTEVYHTDINCDALKNCEAEIIMMDIGEAKKLYRQCEVCRR